MAVKTNKSESCSKKPEKIVPSLLQSSIATPVALTWIDEFGSSSNFSETHTTDTSQNQVCKVFTEKNITKSKETSFQNGSLSNCLKNSNTNKFDTLRTQVSSFFSEQNKTKEKDDLFLTNSINHHFDPLKTLDPSLFSRTNTTEDTSCQLQIDVLNKKSAEKFMSMLEESMNALS